MQRGDKATEDHPSAGNQDFNGSIAKEEYEISVEYLAYYEGFI